MRSDRRRGVVLAMVLILGLLLSAAVVSFSSRAMIDGMISRNRDRAARAEALARGGVQLALGLILEDALADAREAEAGQPSEGDTLDDDWARLGALKVVTAEGDTLSVRIQDTGSLLNLNALVDYAAEDSEFVDQSEAEEFLVALLDKVIEVMEVAPGEKFYEPRELGQNLIDYIDPNDVRFGGGGDEDAYYQQQTPPYRAANRPFLSVEELAMVEGFDDNLVRSLSRYVTVFPAVNAQGINLNTAPPHVLTAVYHGTSGDRRLASEDDVQRILKMREQGKIICDKTESDPDRCVAISEVLEGSIYPPVELPSSSSVFKVTSEAKVGNLQRTLEAVIDRQEAGSPRVLVWRYH